MKCKMCPRVLNERVDVRWTISGAVFCSLNCVWRYRGKERCV